MAGMRRSQTTTSTASRQATSKAAAPQEQVMSRKAEWRRVRRIASRTPSSSSTTRTVPARCLKGEGEPVCAGKPSVVVNWTSPLSRGRCVGNNPRTVERFVESGSWVAVGGPSVVARSMQRTAPSGRSRRPRRHSTLRGCRAC